MKIIHSDSSSNRHRSADLKNDSAGLPDLLRLPYDFRPSQEMEYKKGTFRFILDGFLLEKFQAMVSGHDTTKPLILLTGFGILLSRYSIQNDFLIGVPMVRSYTSNQDSMKHRPVDIVPVRYQMQDDNSFGDALVNMKGSFQSLSAGADVQHPYGSGDPSRVSEKEIKPAYQVVFNYLTPFEEEINLPGVTPQMLNGQLKSLKTDLLLSIVDHSTTMECILEYNSGSFTADTISRMAGHYKTILRAVTHHEDLKIIKIPILTGTESHQLLQVWNETSKIYAKDKCMHQLFEEQVERTPDSVAVVYEDDTATYREVNMRANQLAHYLVRNGAREDTIVALCMERGINMLVALLAISKSGASYLPVDPIYPKARQDSILTDAKPVFLLTQSSLLDSIPVTDLKTILFDTRDLVKEEPSGNLSFGNSDKPLYVLYTSGSTGKPKGVPVRHNSTVNVVNSLSRLIGVTDKDILFTVTTIAFDLAELDIYMTLLSGARLVIGSQEAAMNMELLIKKLDESKATLFQATPITYKMLIRAGWKGKSDLKIISGGDAMTKELGKQLLSRCLEVWNCWGPTETTIYNTGKKVTEEDTSGEGLVSIGKPLDNNTLYVLNQGMIPVPVGVGGEVYIGGDGISPGYLNLPELTAEKFIQNPFSKDPGDILYKSGDLVKYLPDGNLAFLSRVDTQVKIRGFRIELEEIESVLLRYEGIRETIVIAREDVPGEKKLVAYYSLKPGIDILHHDLRRFLAEKLPEYMIPSAFVRLNTLPLTANNKVDRKALPVPDLTEMESDPDFIPPSTDIEKRLAVIWQEVLDLPTISIDTNFFEAGGHSLTATQVLSKVNTEFHLELPFRIIFENFTIRELTRYIGQSVPNTTRAREMHKISPKPVSGANGSPLSSSQQRIWFLENLDESIRAYNIPLDFKISGPLDIQALNAAINVLISRHEAFRTLFLDTMGEPVQKIIPELRGDIEIVHLEEKPTEELQGLIADYSLENARFKFHLARGPLFRFQLLVLRNHEFIFLINFHHIIFDAVSIKIFLDELKLVYGALINKSSPDLPLLPVTYSDYSSWQHQWLKGVECKRQMEFLKTELSGVPDVLQLPLDFPRPKAQTYHGREYHFIVDPELKIN